MKQKIKPMGRPSKTGLSVKELGLRAYSQAYCKLFRPRKTDRRCWTGINTKLVSHAEYMAQWRKMRLQIQRNAKGMKI